ncbi:MAG: GspH/FimT family protein, partial [Candidatus Rokuibacteriota bacterium]
LSSYARTAALQAAARELAASINLGRQIAISRNTTVCVELASATNIRLRTGGCGGAAWTGSGTDGSGAIRVSDSAALRISGSAHVVFTSLGAASPAGHYTLTHAVSNGMRTVVVAATGRVSVR